MRVTLICAALAAAAVAGEEASSDAETAWKALRAEYDAAMQEFYRPFREAKTDEERAKVKVDWNQTPDVAYAAKFRAFAEKHADSPSSAQALLMLGRVARKPEDQAFARDTLLSRHLGSEVMAEGASLFRDEASLRKILAGNEHREVKGRTSLLLAKAIRDSRREEALALLESVRKEYGDILLWGKKTLAMAAEGEINDITRLSVGMEAPEIEGTDLEGKAMRLSEFRGKVVLLDFWGDW